MTITRQEVAANRDKWIARLLDPASKKAKGMLEDPDGGMCCLGHGCNALGLERLQRGMHIFYECERNEAPYKLQKIVGLHDACGGAASPMAFEQLFNGGEYECLTELNDKSSLSPQEIGAYLQSVKEGGRDTPFRPLSDYPDANSGAKDSADA